MITENNTVAEIKAYLDEKGISYLSSATKAELLALVPVEEAPVEEAPVEAPTELVAEETPVEAPVEPAPIVSEPVITWETMIEAHPEEPKPVYTDVYTVQPGDTLASIANAHMMSVGKLKKLNNLSLMTVTVGRVLRLS